MRHGFQRTMTELKGSHNGKDVVVDRVKFEVDMYASEEHSVLKWRQYSLLKL
jgi:hypothetical protein